jgi:hypothetical protein
LQPGLIVDRHSGGVNEPGSIFGAVGQGVQEKRAVNSYSPSGVRAGKIQDHQGAHPTKAVFLLMALWRLIKDRATFAQKSGRITGQNRDAARQFFLSSRILFA